MGKANRLMTIFLMVCMVLASGALLYSTMYASNPARMSSEATLEFFNAPSGIRYNELTEAFEVFSAEGVSWIGSGGWVSTTGLYSSYNTPKPTQTELSGIWYNTAGTATYNIMCDIEYEGTYDPDDYITDPPFNMAFNNGIQLKAGGKINGNGYYLSGFPVRNTVKSSALIASNSGRIENLNIKDVSFNAVTQEQASVGILCVINESNGVIDNCAVYGEYSSDKFPSMYGIAAENSGTIMNSKNYAKLINSGVGVTFTAGITEVLAGSNVVNNINNGVLVGRTPFSSSAGIAFCKNDVAGIVSGNVNNAVVSAIGTATGVMGGVETQVLQTGGNTNNGELFAERTFFDYHGVVLSEANPDVIPPNGIRWNPDLGLFEIYNSAGVSHISMGYWFNAEGLMRTTSQTNYQQATMESHYRIMNDIVYNASEPGFNPNFANVPTGKAPRIGTNGIIDGGGYTLRGFPIRGLSANIFSLPAYSAFLLYSRGVIRNLTFTIDNRIERSTDSVEGVLAAGLTGSLHRVGVSGYIMMAHGLSSKPVGIFSGALGAWGVDDSLSSASDILVRDCWTAVDINGEATSSPLCGITSKWSTVGIRGFANFGEFYMKGNASGVLNQHNSVYIDARDCYNYGIIISFDGYAGGMNAGHTSGLAGWMRCINYGNIEGKLGAGGFFGWMSGATVRTYSRLINYGTIISATSNAAGSIIGYADVTTIQNLNLSYCENYGGVGQSPTNLMYGAAARFVGGSTKYNSEGNNMSIDPR